MLNQLPIEEMYLNIIKAIYNKAKANIVLSGEMLKALFLRSGKTQRCSLLLLLFNTVLELLATEIR